MESNSLINYPSRSDLCLEEDVKGEDNVKPEFICPFCADEFDILGLCCHIDEDHPVEAKNGVCPVCSKKMGLDIVGHITTQHANVFKISFLFCYYHRVCRVRFGTP
ncbi:Protein DEHYDRATION-INDUCED 19 7 [Hirschfeldia incana]|nr:Protein DEHYDRATION-INDUCED 19 7 [Hirschfeldia incana]